MIVFWAIKDKWFTGVERWGAASRVIAFRVIAKSYQRFAEVISLTEAILRHDPKVATQVQELAKYILLILLIYKIRSAS